MAMKITDLNGVQKAAILLITLGPDKAANVFKHLKEDEIEELTLEIANTRSVSPQEKEDILLELLGDIVLLLQSPMQKLVSALESGKNTICGELKTLEERG